MTCNMCMRVDYRGCSLQEVTGLNRGAHKVILVMRDTRGWYRLNLCICNER